MEQDEMSILKALDVAVRSILIKPRIDQLLPRLEQKLDERPDDVLAWASIPLDSYTSPLPETIRSSWIFVLRADTITGAERHPNSHQRMMSYRGHGDFQTRTEGDWHSHLLTSDRSSPIEQRVRAVDIGFLTELRLATAYSARRRRCRNRPRRSRRCNPGRWCTPLRRRSP